MTINKCDRCKEEIKDNSKEYMLRLEEWDRSTGFYVDKPTTQMSAQICVNCYKTLWGEIM